MNTWPRKGPSLISRSENDCNAARRLCLSSAFSSSSWNWLLKIQFLWPASYVFTFRKNQEQLVVVERRDAGGDVDCRIVCRRVAHENDLALNRQRAARLRV